MGDEGREGSAARPARENGRGEKRRWVRLCVAGVVASCGTGHEGGGARGVETEGGRAEPVRELASSLEVKVGTDSVRFVLHVTNPGGAGVELEYATAQRFDFVVESGGGEEVWRWSAERRFEEVVGREVVGGGETVRYEAAWHAGVRAGEYVGVGLITARDAGVEQRLAFTLP